MTFDTYSFLALQALFQFGLDRVKVNSRLFGGLLQQLLRFRKVLTDAIPERLVGHVLLFGRQVGFVLKGGAPARESTAFAPAIAVIVNSFNVLIVHRGLCDWNTH